MLHGDGEIFLIYYEEYGERFCYVVMQNDISDCIKFNSNLEEKKYYDWETPYGYGGPLSDMVISEKTQKKFLKEIKEYCVKNCIVSQFVRFHPLLNNYETLPLVIEKRYLRDTIYIDTESPELIINNMESKNRNMVRKAVKSNVCIVKKEITDFENFLFMYKETMEKNNADEYYMFKRNYFESLSNLKDNAFILYAMLDDIPISGAILYFNDRFMHYHLAGSKIEYRKYSAGNLLLYKAACMANCIGIKQFHLGGGMEPNDSLFKFKKQFNKNGYAKFYVGRTIFDKEKYQELLEIRKKIDLEFNANNEFMIQYRR